MSRRIQLKTEQQLVRRTLHFSPGFERVGVQLRPGVRRACPQDFVLAVDAAEDVSSLDERDDLPFCVFHRPAEGRAHALESNRREWLEIEHDCARADLRRETQDVWAEQGIKVITSLMSPKQGCLFASVSGRKRRDDG